MLDRLKQLQVEALSEVANTTDLKELNDLRVKYLGKKGELTAVLKSMKDVAPEDRPMVGQLVNETREAIEEISAKTVTIKKPDIIKHLWMNKKIESLNCNSIYQQYPVIHKLKTCIDDFREIFNRRSMPLLYLFIERYKKSEFAPVASFAKGLERDIDAVENAVASPLNNGFVEGINNRTKMIKRVMYGRCGIELLAAKIMLPYASKTDI